MDVPGQGSEKSVGKERAGGTLLLLSEGEGQPRGSWTLLALQPGFPRPSKSV